MLSVSIRRIYLSLAIIGGVAPYVFFFRHFAATGFGAQDFLGAVFANPAAGGFTADLVITSLVFWIAILRRRSLRQGPRPLWFVVINLTIGLSCALPAYLYASHSEGDTA